MKKTMAIVLACLTLLLVQACALADGMELDYSIDNEYRSALYGRARLQSFAYDYSGYAGVDSLGRSAYDRRTPFVHIITKSASVWSMPRTNSKKLGSVSHGDELTCVLDDSDRPLTDGDFFVVKYKGNTGYVNQSYAVVSPLEIVLLESNVPAYIAPDTHSKCVGSLAKHTRYTVIGMYDDFYIINLRGAAAAYIHKSTRCYDSRFEDFYLDAGAQTGTIIRNTTLRTGPGEHFAKVADVKAGDTFEFYDMINAWHMLRYTPKGSSDSFFVFVYCNDVDVPIANG